MSLTPSADKTLKLLKRDKMLLRSHSGLLRLFGERVEDTSGGVSTLASRVSVERGRGLVLLQRRNMTWG